MINEMRKLHLHLKQTESGQEKMSPALRELRNALEGDAFVLNREGAAAEKCARLTDAEKESLKEFVLRRHAELLPLAAHAKVEGSHLKDSIEAVEDIAKAIGLTLPAES